MHDRLSNGRSIRTMNIVDDFTRECLAREIATHSAVQMSYASLRILRFVASCRQRFVLTMARSLRAVQCFSGADRDVALHFVDPGKPTQNAHIESLNSRIRDEFLNAHVFTSIFSARSLADAWRRDYNEDRIQPSAIALRGSSLKSFKQPNPHSWQWRKFAPSGQAAYSNAASCAISV